MENGGILDNIKFLFYCKVEVLGPLYSKNLEILGDTQKWGLYFFVVDYSFKERGKPYLSIPLKRFGLSRIPL